MSDFWKDYEPEPTRPAMKTTIDMAREAGFNLEQGFLLRVTGIDEDLKRFEALVRADEREACAKVCDEQVERSLAAVEKTKRTTDHRIYRAAAQTATWNAAAIRARGNT
jgi:hypothetical protein